MQTNSTKCPHCQAIVHFVGTIRELETDNDGKWYTFSGVCPSCNRILVYLSVDAVPTISRNGVTLKPRAPNTDAGTSRPDSRPAPRPASQQAGPHLVWPKNATFSPAAPEVPEKLAKDYNEARTILDFSPKASAALARRCLQNLIREHLGIQERDLTSEIQKLLAQGNLPSHLSDNIDAIRHIGNFAAHPIKDQQSTMITEVEPGEAEWILDVLEGLFDFFFVQPENMKKKRAALNEKLKNAGKKTME